MYVIFSTHHIIRRGGWVRYLCLILPVLSAILVMLLVRYPSDKLSKELRTINAENENLPYTSCLECRADKLSIRVTLPDHPWSKRYIFSTIFSIYDPFFVIKLSWDEELPEHQWYSWRNLVKLLNPMKFLVTIFQMDLVLLTYSYISLRWQGDCIW